MVCVVSLEHSTTPDALTPEAVPLGQCREIRTGSHGGDQSHMDRIIIGKKNTYKFTLL